MTDEAKEYKQHPTERIIAVLEGYGANARMAQVCTDMQYDIMGRSRYIQPMESESALAYELAIKRLRELEEKLSAANHWQEKLFDTLNASKPTTKAAENWMGWRLFCLDARKDYDDALTIIAKAISDRKHEEDEYRWRNR